ncbi:MAG: amidohydrolase, partial [Pseudolysinimonas sp.]
MLIDSHVHFWDRGRFDYPWLDLEGEGLRRDFGPIELADAACTLESALDGLVFVQADCLPEQALAEASWAHDLAAQGAPIRAVVAQAPLEQGLECAGHLASLAQRPLVTGVRRLLQDEAPGFAVQPPFVRGVSLLAEYDMSLDLCVRDSQLREVTELAERCPD